MNRESIYTYHPDHLGSSSWITDQDGEAVQHLQYLPFGERYVDQRRVGWNAPYTFSGKERDQETQYIYFGARYYDSELSIWLSVDPMASKYPFVSPYVYCVNNPVKYWDPDGRWIPGLDDDGNIHFTAENGDNTESLINFFGGKDNASRFVSKETLDTDREYGAGERVNMKDNAFTALTKDAANNPGNYQPSTGADSWTDNRLNCHAAALGLSLGRDVIGWRAFDTERRNDIIDANFDNVHPRNAVFGQTIVTFGANHTGVYFGTDNSGNAYIFDVPGTGGSPAINTLQQRAGNHYGAVRNIHSNAAGQVNTYNKEISKYGHIRPGSGSGFYNRR